LSREENAANHDEKRVHRYADCRAGVIGKTAEHAGPTAGIKLAEVYGAGVDADPAKLPVKGFRHLGDKKLEIAPDLHAQKGNGSGQCQKDGDHGDGKCISMRDVREPAQRAR